MASTIISENAGPSSSPSSFFFFVFRSFFFRLPCPVHSFAPSSQRHRLAPRSLSPRTCLRRRTHHRTTVYSDCICIAKRIAVARLESACRRRDNEKSCLAGSRGVANDVPEGRKWQCFKIISRDKNSFAPYVIFYRDAEPKSS